MTETAETLKAASPAKAVFLNDLLIGADLLATVQYNGGGFSGRL